MKIINYFTTGCEYSLKSHLGTSLTSHTVARPGERIIDPNSRDVCSNLRPSTKLSYLVENWNKFRSSTRPFNPESQHRPSSIDAGRPVRRRYILFLNQFFQLPRAAAENISKMERNSTKKPGRGSCGNTCVKVLITLVLPGCFFLILFFHCGYEKGVRMCSYRTGL